MEYGEDGDIHYWSYMLLYVVNLDYVIFFLSDERIKLMLLKMQSADFTYKSSIFLKCFKI